MSHHNEVKWAEVYRTQTAAIERLTRELDALRAELAMAHRGLRSCFAELEEAKARVYRMKLLLRGYMQSYIEHADLDGVSKDGLGKGDPCDCPECVGSRKELAD